MQKSRERGDRANVARLDSALSQPQAFLARSVVCSGLDVKGETGCCFCIALGRWKYKLFTAASLL